MSRCNLHIPKIGGKEILKFNPLKEAMKAEKEHNTKAMEASKRLQYGKHNGYWQWDLACHWFRTSNDAFFQTYGFNFVPRSRLFEEARDFVHANY